VYISCLEVDTPAALKQKLEVSASEMKASLRKSRVRYRSVDIEDGVAFDSFLARGRFVVGGEFVER